MLPARLHEMLLAILQGGQYEKLVTHLLPVIIVPAIIPAVLMPLMMNHYVPNNLIGGAMSVLIGLAVVGLLSMMRADVVAQSMAKSDQSPG